MEGRVGGRAVVQSAKITQTDRKGGERDKEKWKYENLD